MGARLLLSVGHGTYFGIALVVAASLVRPERHAGAVALVISGINVANIIGVPIGVWIGNGLGWRATFWAIAALGACALTALALWVPRQAPAHGGLAGLGHQFRMLKRQEVWLSFAMIFFITIGFFVVFSYIAPTLLYVTHISPETLPWLLALLGVGSLLGIIGGGRVPERFQMQSVIAVFACQIVLDAVLLAALPRPLPATATFFLWSIGNFAFSAPLQSRILRGAREAPNLSASLISSAFNIAISLGSALGAVSLTAGLGYQWLPLLAALAGVPALVLAVVALTIDRRRARLAATTAAA
jgi:DHA1 family inner membrane transport protein